MEQIDLIQLLKNETVTVIFTKEDGTERKMVCTLKKELIPTPSESTESSGPQLLQENVSDVVKVWDVEANAWRSFKTSRVKSISL